MTHAARLGHLCCQLSCGCRCYRPECTPHLLVSPNVHAVSPYVVHCACPTFPYVVHCACPTFPYVVHCACPASCCAVARSRVLSCEASCHERVVLSRAHSKTRAWDSGVVTRVVFVRARGMVSKKQGCCEGQQNRSTISNSERAGCKPGGVGPGGVGPGGVGPGLRKLCQRGQLRAGWLH